MEEEIRNFGQNIYPWASSANIFIPVTIRGMMTVVHINQERSLDIIGIILHRHHNEPSTKHQRSVRRNVIVEK